TKIAYDGALKHLTVGFTGKLRDITPARVKGYVADRVKGGASASTVNRETAVLKMLLKAAVRDHVLSRNPLADSEIKPLRMAPHRVRYLSPGEVELLLDACRLTPCLREFTLVALNTGCRRNEILSMVHSSVDWTNRLVRLTATKTNEARVVHLNETALKALAGLPRRLDGALWPFGPDQVSMAFMRASRKARLVDFHLHDCRHHYLSMAAMNGVNQRVLMELAGHKNLATSQRYVDLSPDFLRQVRESLEIGASR
ncbi:MAG TPA: tyrosine-type recombinase/integrase, partial [Candidatus Binataceae bacterium]|nr:tyrosine-type recombinase/integrase [Candidatus Binataceae bacterium]